MGRWKYWATAATALVLGLLATASQTASAAEEPKQLPPCRYFAEHDIQRGKRIVAPNIPYPRSEIMELGEGSVDLEFSITADGVPTNFRIRDALGNPKYGELAIAGFKDARYEPTRIDGKAIPVNMLSQIVDFNIEGENRVGVQTAAGNATDEAIRLRKQGRFAEALAVLQALQGRSLNLYEATTRAYGLAMSYKGLNDRRRALREIRRATINEGRYIDKNLRHAAFEAQVELEAADNYALASVCTFEQMVYAFPRKEIDPKLMEVATKAVEQLAGTTPVRSEVEIVETDRPDISPHWMHGLTRSTFQIVDIVGNLKSVKLMCPAATLERPITGTLSVSVDVSKITNCIAYVFGDPGAKFVFLEHN